VIYRIGVIEVENESDDQTIRMYVTLPKPTVDAIDLLRGPITRNEWLYKQIMQSIGRKDLADLHRGRGRPRKNITFSEK